jgi:hypothetical protein
LASEKPSTQLIQRIEHFQPLLGCLCQTLAGRGREIGIGARFRPADATAQLVELGQAEHIGTVDDQRIGIRHVEAGFDDRRRQQHIVLPFVERGHHVFEFSRRQLAVGLGDAQIRHCFAQEFGNLVEIGYARHDIIGLPAAIALAFQRISDNDRIEWRNIGSDRKTVDRRRRDQRQFANARQRQLQGARNGRRRQCQHMHILAHLLQALFVDDAEMLFFVDDQQAKPFELDGFAEERMRADDDIDGARLHRILGFNQILRRHEAGGLRDLDRQSFEPLGKGAEMLPREQRCRHHDRDL